MLYYLLHIWNNKRWLIDNDNEFLLVKYLQWPDVNNNRTHNISQKSLRLRNTRSIWDDETKTIETEAETKIETETETKTYKWSQELNIPGHHFSLFVRSIVFSSMDYELENCWGCVDCRVSIMWHAKRSSYELKCAEVLRSADAVI